jgi:TatD DNase family protein
MNALVDIGANLTNKAFSGDLPAVLQRAKDNGVTNIVVTGTSTRESGSARDLAEQHPGFLHATAGVHPHNAKDCDTTTLATLRELAASPRVVAIGECGLDFNRDFSPRPVQSEWFEKQVELAVELEMPLFMHERDAGTAMVEILARHRDKMVAGVVHCFTGDEATLDAYLALDLHVGITGWICDERRGAHLHDLVAKIPLDRLMLETDAPYLTPRTIRPKPKSRRNEPAFLPHVLATVSQCLDLPESTVAAATTKTSVQFFQLN